MMVPARLLNVTAFAAAVVIGMLAPVAAAQENETPAQLLDNFVFYTNVARPELAAAYAKKLFSSGLADTELAELVDSSARSAKDIDKAISKARKRPELEDLAADLEMRIRSGRLGLARDPARIKAAIADLVVNMRSKATATDLLRAAGEYAVPQLLSQIEKGNDERLKLECVNALHEIGRTAVTPLCVALPNVDEGIQRILCDLLALIKYPHAAPYLLALSKDPAVASVVRDAASRAFRTVGGQGDDLSVEFGILSTQYFNEVATLVAFPVDANNNVWTYDKFNGLEPTPVPTAIFCEVMSMKTARMSLDANAGSVRALSLYVAANLKRANELPEGAADPIYGDLPRSPEFFATVFGTQICQSVLAMAIDASDTLLVRDAIAALSQTTGSANLLSTGDQRKPLLEALDYPDRRVRYDTALVLGKALPKTGFAGDYTVVPQLASAVRSGGQSFAVVVADNDENRRVRRDQLVAQGYVVVAQADDAAGLQAELAQAIGVDVVVIEKSRADVASEMVTAVRSMPKTATAAIVVLASSDDMTRLKEQYENDRRVKVGSAAAVDKAFALVVEEAVRRTSGGRITEAEAEAYAIEAMSALRDIAISNSAIYRINDAEPALRDALDTRSGGTRTLVAGILSLIDTATAQQKLFDAALVAAGDEQVELLDVLAASIRRFGNRAEAYQVDGLVVLLTTSTGATAEAAARVHGAMNLPGGAVIELLR